MRIGDRRRLRRDPLDYIGTLRRRTATAVVELPWGGWCVGDPDLAQALLREREFNADRSGFFGELLPTRAAQIEVGHAVRDFLRARVPDRATLAAAVAGLPTTGRWPDAGTTLVHHCLKDLLLHPGTPARTRRLMDRAVHGGVVFRAPHTWQRARAEILRAALVTAVAEQVAHRRGRHRADEPRDVLDAVLDAVLRACPEQAGDRTVAELHLTMFRSIVAPVGISLAWSVLLGCLHHTADTPWPWPVDHVVREAMRYRPMVWMVGRAMPGPTEFGGVSFQPGDVLSVSPYLLHHDEDRWSDPGVFRPERWARPTGHGPYVPFGAGPFTCPGASVAQTLITRTLTALTDDARLSVTGGDTRAAMVEGIVPRSFTLHRAPRSKPTPISRGGEQP